jgi:hypothetical protein
VYSRPHQNRPVILPNPIRVGEETNKILRRDRKRKDPRPDGHKVQGKNPRRGKERERANLERNDPDEL